MNPNLLFNELITNVSTPPKKSSSFKDFEEKLHLTVNPNNDSNKPTYSFSND